MRPRVVACRARPRRRELSLSFDDGPSEWTPSLLDALAEYGAHATFFVLGEAVQGREAILQRAVAEGHELGNHTFGHRDSSELTDQELRAELMRAGEEIRAAVGFVPRLARPPYMEDARRFAGIAAALGFRPTVLASVDARDWDEPDGRADRGPRARGAPSQARSSTSTTASRHDRAGHIRAGRPRSTRSFGFFRSCATGDSTS